MNGHVAHEWTHAHVDEVRYVREIAIVVVDRSAGDALLAAVAGERRRLAGGRVPPLVGNLPGADQAHRRAGGRLLGAAGARAGGDRDGVAAKARAAHRAHRGTGQSRDPQLHHRHHLHAHAVSNLQPRGIMRATNAVLAAIVLLTLVGCEYMPWYEKKHDGATTAPAAEKPKGAAEKEPTRSLYDRLGGEKAIRAVVEDFVPRAAADEKVNFTRKGVAGHEWQ